MVDGEKKEEEGWRAAIRPPRVRLGRTNVVGWSNMPHELKMELKVHTNHGFPMALLEAKRHVHGGFVKIPVVTYGEDKDARFFFGRPTDWPDGLASKVLRREAHVDVMTLSISDDFGILAKSLSKGSQTHRPPPTHPHPHHHREHNHLAKRTGGGAKGDSNKNSASFADEVGSSSSRPCFIGVATASLQGGCSYQEDRFVSFEELSEVPNVKVPPGISFFGVYDGHGGSKVAEYLMEHLHLNFVAELRRPRACISSALRASFKRTDKELLEMWCSMSAEERKESGHAEDYCSGAAAVVVVMQERRVVIAHVGDCRVALCTKGKCVDLTVDHTYQNCSERTRVSDVGGMWEAERLDGTLAVSRAFGDFEVRCGDGDGKPLGLVSDPEMREMSLGPDDEFLLVSSDGLWADQNIRGGLASSRAAVEFARARLQENGNNLSTATDALVQEAVKAAESDNTTAILVSFQDLEQVEVQVKTPVFRNINIPSVRQRFINVPSMGAVPWS